MTRLAARMCTTLALACLPAGASFATNCLPTWRSVDPVPGVAYGTVAALQVHVYEGKTVLLIGGSFTAAGTSPARSLVMWDGQAWGSIGDFDGDVSALAVYKGLLVAGGSFGTIDGKPSDHIAAWTGSAWIPLGDGFDGSVAALHVHDGQLIATGSFSHSGSVAANRIAAWDGTKWSALGTGLSNGYGQCLTTFEGDLVVGGSFTTAGGVSANHIAGWNGSTWFSFGSLGMSETVFALSSVDINPGKVVDERLVAAGFEGIKYYDHPNFVTLDGGADDWVFGLYRSGTDLIVGGRFQHVGEGLEYIPTVARWSAALGWHGTGLASALTTSGQAYAFAEMGGDLYAGGYFWDDGVEPLYGLARWTGAEWTAPMPGLGGGPEPAVLALAPHEGGLLVGGRFTAVGDGVDANNIALWKNGVWSRLHDGLGDPLDATLGENYVSAISSAPGDLVAAYRTEAGPRLAIYDGKWSDLPLTFAQHDYIHALYQNSGALYVGGNFAAVNGQTVNNVLQYDDGVLIPLGGGLTGVVYALASFEGDVIAAGDFTVTGGKNVSRWNGSAWLSVGPGVGSEAFALAVHNGSLFAGTSQGVYEWVPSRAQWKTVATTGGYDVLALASFNGDLYCGGDFVEIAFPGAGTHAVRRIARLEPGSHDVGGVEETMDGGDPACHALAVAAGDSVLGVGGSFAIAGDAVSHGFARLVSCATTSARDVNPPIRRKAESGPLLTGDTGRARYTLALGTGAVVDMDVSDPAGRRVGGFRDRPLPAGRHTIALPSRAPSGVYTARAVVRVGESSVRRSARIVVWK